MPKPPSCSPSTTCWSIPCAGRSSTWTRIRINLRHVPEAIGRRRKRPTQTMIPRANGASAWRRKSKQARLI